MSASMSQGMPRIANSHWKLGKKYGRVSPSAKADTGVFLGLAGFGLKGGNAQSSESRCRPVGTRAVFKEV